jgi:hypothetical protein
VAQIVVDAMNNAAVWSAISPDGVTPSGEIAMADDTSRFRYGADATSGRLTASAAALNHLLRRTLAAIDLSASDELRFAINADRDTGESGVKPFFLEVRLASAAMSFATPANTWHRFLPVARAGAWELVRLDLTGLHPAVRAAVNGMQLRCVDASRAFTCNVDDVVAVRNEMFADVEATLQRRLHQKVVLNGSPVPAVIHVPDVSLPPRPFLRIVLRDVRFADPRTPGTSTRCDFSSDGYRLRLAGAGYDLYYQVDVWADDRPSQTRLLEFALGELVVNGAPLPMTMIEVRPRDLIGGARTDRVGFHYRIGARLESPAASPVKPVTMLEVMTDARG